jgi:hypothetical protein
MAYQKLPFINGLRIYSYQFRGRVHDSKGISSHTEGKPEVKATS